MAVVRPPVPHVAMRPLWRCRNCGREWPCQPAKLALLTEYRENRTALLVYLGTLMQEATSQLTQLNPDRRPDMADRFVAWARARG
ncbi:flavin reductase [Micromonospora sp. HUAS LYJ1]|uniref:flavin reductase n=1 Tax=Micromonospora sp. HUAS LYJ1 TaxID=3061626 RepID=UPI002671AF2F|nr:flavin reductase [Micromonospora sp. HUAS LYJ1]WKU04206.1 flavin reductase [Micromonospora sp. HUAS LYJ1]